jgi:GNAT superfamily N-acetyltransferase
MAPADPTEIRELQVGETHLAHEAIRTLRAAQVSEQAFVAHVDGVLRPGGYTLVGVLAPAREQALAVAGFRICDSLALGHFLYVDDLSTVAEARRQGHARALMDWLALEARRLDCAQIHLDSVVGPARFDAHRFYHAWGMSIYAHHFALMQ